MTEKVDTIVVGLAAVAEHFGRSERQVRRWLKDGMPRLSQKRFDVLQIQEWIDRRSGIRAPRETYIDPKQMTFADAAPAADKDVHEARLKRHKADLAEMEVRQKRAELMEKKELEQLLVSRIMACKQGLLTLARSLPPQLIHCKTEREMEVIIQGAVRELLLGFSRPLPDALGGVAVDIDGDQDD